MEEEDVKRMWKIDSDSQVGNPVSADDEIWFNKNFNKMLQEMEDNYNHWKYHTSKF